MSVHIRNPFNLAIIAAAIACSAATAGAGVIDTALPTISNSASTRMLYIVPGVQNSGGLETAFICSSLDTSGPQTVAIEVFDAAGGAPLNNVALPTGDGNEVVQVGGTVTISTGTLTGMHEDEAIVSLTDAHNGTARILSTTTRLVCTAMVVNKASTPPSLISTLNVFARRKQNGD